MGSSSSAPTQKSWMDQPVRIKEIKNDEVEYELEYSRTGSRVPTCLHGIWWADQFCASTIGRDPDFLDELPMRHLPSEEIVVSFCEDWPTVWDEERMTLGPIPNSCGRKGHLTWLNHTNGGNKGLEEAAKSHLYVELKFLDADKLWVDTKAFGVSVPQRVMAMYMEKRPWGFTRVTTLGESVFDTMPTMQQELLTQSMGEGFTKTLRMGTKGAFQYPVLQIVDGDGRRTRWYAEYLEFVNEKSFNKSQLVGCFEGDERSWCETRFCGPRLGRCNVPASI